MEIDRKKRIKDRWAMIRDGFIPMLLAIYGGIGFVFAFRAMVFDDIDFSFYWWLVSASAVMAFLLVLEAYIFLMEFVGLGFDALFDRLFKKRD